jgi:hypothetical protein
MAKCVIVLYPDPVTGYPPKYARDNIPVLRSYPDGSSLPTPSKIDFEPGELLGCVSGALGLRSRIGGHVGQGRRTRSSSAHCPTPTSLSPNPFGVRI